ncbi:TlpA family protein disulfide reductase [Puia sp. P3]|uniref:TlpA family protein disulfide reductase n=1 Tax=Puia sp. P3 TaxID=3423952 RepID=UPI003D66E9A6
MKRTLLVDSIAFFFILLFLYTATAKLLDWHTFREELQSSPIVGNFAGVIVWALPILEIILAFALFVPAWKLYGLYATFILMVLFTAYVGTILLIDNQLSCSCGGIIENLPPDRHIIFNGICVFLAGLAILIHRRQAPTPKFQWLTSSFSVLSFLLLGWILFTAFTTKSTVKTGKEGRLLPAFEVLLPDSTTKLNTAEIPTGSPFVVIGFSPWCTHCQAEARDIVKNIAEWKGTQIYFVTPYPFKDMKGFYTYFKMDKCANITMGRDLTNAFFKYFDSKAIPYTTVFDSKKRLKQVFIGETKSADVRKVIEN